MAVPASLREDQAVLPSARESRRRRGSPLRRLPMATQASWARDK
jgi:hypothetical protein